MWKYKVQLNSDETLRYEGRQTTASGEEVTRYSIVNACGDVTGSVHLTECANDAVSAQSQLHIRRRLPLVTPARVRGLVTKVSAGLIT